MTGDHMPDVR